VSTALTPLYLLFAILKVCFSYLFVYETSNLSLEEVDELYSQTTAMKSKSVNAQIRAQRSDLEVAAGKQIQEHDSHSSDEEKKE